jgi:hypothetical protein
LIMMAETWRISCLRGISHTKILAKRSAQVRNMPRIFGVVNTGYLIRICIESRPCKILSGFSRKPCPKFCDFYPDKMVPQAKKFLNFIQDLHTPLRWLSGVLDIHPGA